MLGPQNALWCALIFRIKLKQDFENLGFFFGSRFILKPFFFWLVF